MAREYEPRPDMRERPHSSSGGAGNTDEDQQDNPACQSCRRRKLRCPRETPSCSQCARLDIECVYVATRKPGMKTGAIEALNRRLQTLEDVVLRDGHQEARTLPQGGHEALLQVSQVLIKELQRLGSSQLRPSEREEAIENGLENGNGRKRKRQEGDRVRWNHDDGSNIVSSLPPDSVLKAMTHRYFQTFQHWIPFLHEGRFKRDLNDPQATERNAVVLHAMVSATLKLLHDPDHGMEMAAMQNQIKHSREVVMLTAMSRPSLENLQALVIIAFDHIGQGEVDKAWSLIGSLTRTVEYLRLTVEPEELQRHPLRRPLTLLGPTSDWTDIESRRRLFWNIFLLDRFCSITTGWNTSLTSDDVHRKLPCDGGFWSREEMSDTPYFGIWNKSAAKIGNSIAFIPAHYPTPDHEVEHDNMRSPGVGSNPATVDTSKLGAFAYCIEATESLSQVTTFFLQQRIDFQNRQEVGSWLTRFKELDLRLVHWKMFLPQKWKDSNISRDISFVNMDPNLTLAHITHNTSMILLHQHIAYPPPHWNDVVKLPSSCSAETCQMAAVETSAICQKYLKYTEDGILNPQFALCTFIAARILLVHWRFCGVDLSPEFFSLVECLRDMSRRWQGTNTLGHKSTDDQSDSNIAGQYAHQLQGFHTSFSQKPDFCMNVLGYHQDSAGEAADSLLPGIYTNSQALSVIAVSPRTPRTPRQAIHPNNNLDAVTKETGNSNYPAATRDRMASRFSNGDPSSPRSMERTQQQGSVANFENDGWRNFSHSNLAPTNFNGMNPNLEYDTASVDDELTAMSNALLGQQFLEMDRVITYDGTNFAIDLDGWSNIN